MIKRFSVKGYKCFADFTMELSNAPLVFFSGVNGVGKSTFFEVLALIRDIVCRGCPLVDAEGSFLVMGDTLTRWLPKAEDQSFELTVELNGRIYSYQLVVDVNTSNRKPRIRMECLTCDGIILFRCIEGDMQINDNSGNQKVSFHVDWGTSFIASVAERRENQLLIAFRKWLANIIYLKPIPPQMTSVAPVEMQMPDRELRNFASWFRYLKQSGGDDRYYSFLEDAKVAIPGLTSLTLRDVGNKAKELLVEIKTSEAQSLYSFSELSEGQRMLIALYAIIHFAITDGATICIDEPDNYLAMGEVTSLIETLQNVCEGDGGGQTMIVSHHPGFYRQIGVEYGFVITRGQNGGVSVRNMKELLRGRTSAMAVEDVIARGWEA